MTGTADDLPTQAGAAIDMQKEAFTYYLNGGGDRAITRSKSGIGGPFYEVKRYPEVVQDPQVIHNGVVRTMSREDLGEFHVIGPPIRMSETPTDAGNPPPRLGEHTEEILRSLGDTEQQLAALREKGVVQVGCDAPARELARESAQERTK